MIFDTFERAKRSLLGRSLVVVLLQLLLAPAFLEASPRARTYSGKDLFRGIQLGYGPVVDRLPELGDRKLETLIKSPQVRRVLIAEYEKIISSIESADPEFFQRFGREVQSGDHLRIAKALDEANRAVSDAVSRLPWKGADGAAESSQADSATAEGDAAASRSTASAPAERAGDDAASGASEPGTADRGELHAVDEKISSMHGDMHHGSQKICGPWACVAGIWLIAGIDIAVAVFHGLIFQTGAAFTTWAWIFATRWLWGPQNRTAGSQLVREQLVNSIATHLAVRQR